MTKFKLGDKVIVKQEGYEGIVGIVTEIAHVSTHPDPLFGAVNSTVYTIETTDNKTLQFDENVLELYETAEYTKFAVGNVVWISAKAHDHYKEVGFITKVNINEDKTVDYRVHLDKEEIWVTEEGLKLFELNDTETNPDAPVDNVNHPSHYETGKFECIDVMEEALGKDAVMSFCVCNAFKYIYRHKRKNGSEDVAKAKWYIDKYLELDGYYEKKEKEANA